MDLISEAVSFTMIFIILYADCTHL